MSVAVKSAVQCCEWGSVAKRIICLDLLNRKYSFGQTLSFLQRLPCGVNLQLAIAHACRVGCRSFAASVCSCERRRRISSCASSRVGGMGAAPKPGLALERKAIINCRMLHAKSCHAGVLGFSMHGYHTSPKNNPLKRAQDQPVSQVCTYTSHQSLRVSLSLDPRL